MCVARICLISITHQARPDMNIPLTIWQTLLRCALAAALILGLQGCDIHKAKRQEAERQLVEQQAAHSVLVSHQQSLLAKQTKIRDGLSQAAAMHAEANQEQAMARADLVGYLSQHKAATAALIVGGSAAALSTDPEARQMLDQQFGPGAADVSDWTTFVSAVYCISEFSECGSVAGEMAKYEMKAKAWDKRHQDLNAFEQQAHSELARIDSELKAQGPKLDASLAEIDATKARIAELQCKGPLC